MNKQVWRLPGWLAGWLARMSSQPKREAVGLLESLQTAGLEAGGQEPAWLAGWLARVSANLRIELWAY